MWKVNGRQTPSDGKSSNCLWQGELKEFRISKEHHPTLHNKFCLYCPVQYICNSDWRPAFNRRSILKSMSEFYVTDICTSELSPFFKFSNLCRFSNSQIGIQFSNLWRVLTLSNRRPMMSLTYALTNKSAIDLRIWKGHRFENNLNRSMNWDNKVSGCRSEEWMPIWVQKLIWVHHIYNRCRTRKKLFL